MNAIHKILAINEKELALNIPDNASWHADYADTSYIYIGNLHESLGVQDVLVIFSQYGNPTHINLVKDGESGKSRGFCFLKYEDHRSCVLAIDNFNGTLIRGKPLKVDHTYYKLARGQSEDDFRVEYPDVELSKRPLKRLKSAPKLLPYEEGQKSENNDNVVNEDGRSPGLANDDDFADPMAAFLGADSVVQLDSKDGNTKDRRGSFLQQEAPRESKRQCSER